VFRGPESSLPARSSWSLWLPALLVLSLLATGAGVGAQNASDAPSLTVEITSPLGRTGMTGPVRIVARITHEPAATISPVQFFVDDELIGEDADGPPYAVQWSEANPFERRRIAVQVSDSTGAVATDEVELAALELEEHAFVSSVVLEPSVRDARGRPVNDLALSDFTVYEDEVPQQIEMTEPGTVPANYTLLIDTSQSMSRRIDFVRNAALELVSRIRPIDQVTVVPFAMGLGTITGPTRDRDTVTAAVNAIRSGGGTSILDSLAGAVTQLGATSDRHIVVLITDGYDEDSEASFDEAMAAVRASQITVYVVAIGGVAGISLRGEESLRAIAEQTGGRAFFPSRDFQLSDMHQLIAMDVQQRYVLAYTPSNQRLDGEWRTIRVETTDPEYKIVARPGYTAPRPPPVRPTIELTVRDLTRQYIDVTPEDFTVLEDGVEQTIEGFEESVTPISLMLVLDASGSMRPDQEALVEAARTFAEQLPGRDPVGVITFADRPVLTQELTYVREFILWAIEEYQPAGGTALYDAILRALSELDDAEGRAAIVLLTDGRDEDNPGTGPGSESTLDEVLQRLEEVRSTIYAIGLGPEVDRDTLERLVAASSGEAYFPADVTTLADDYRRIVENLRRRYAISYTSTNPEYNGAWREVDILPNREGLAVDSDGGYFAPTLD